MSKFWTSKHACLRFSSLVLGFSVAILQADTDPQPEYSSPVAANYPKDVYWGDTHLHTRNSADAYSLGNLNLTPTDAYRFARGQAITAHNGMQVQLRRPLDFLVVSDHAEYLGGYYRFDVADPLVVETAAGNQWKEFEDQGDPIARIGTFTASMQEPEKFYPFPEKVRKLIWEDVAETADDNNRPGVFTAFTGYEWTSMISGNNLHRVVLYKDGAEKAAQIPPFSGQDSLDPRDLWQALAHYEEATGGSVMAIAHNGNISNGMMFSDTSVDGEAINADYAKLRSRWEPVYEVTQVKGDGESHPTLSPDDEFADFENWDRDNIGRTEDKQDAMLKHEYARSALKLGLRHEQELGVNPFKFGLIGSTDGHNSVSTTEEDNFFGKFPDSQPGKKRLDNQMAGVLWQNWRIVASGYAAAWARENTREALFEAFKRREVYATTGSRIQVRFFGGWNYQASDIDRPSYLDIAYSGGVPMGGDLLQAPENKAPSFMVVAAKDPDGANLDRVQIIKGWLQQDGVLREKVYDVVWSGERSPDPETGKLPAVGNTVDVETATYLNSIGSTDLAVVWTDPDFDAGERAFYYARVLEIPKPRWTTYDAVYFNLELSEEIPKVIQDRAYTSPVWYTP
ncbi:MAG: DUF3604 domain-containing protein [Gammaproteobacteria bacterium]|jgi:hypothetical protein|nr:DUF3604 domain-containing protein [Gammaproteobacteria bacterium]MBT5205326.1 DUF3604 domain-containing protein [Gammaproteobacteria bacterium]MBT5602200.1 DUF3604 domain-containing protein [Gammaproteobacteria bacterium]MBT6246727.1 DUF3604 domain-containing protein [Gammaproteobacteria bacterium]